MQKNYIFIITMLVFMIPSLLFSGPVSALTEDHCLKRDSVREQYTGIQGMPFGGRMGGMLRMMDSLNLTKEQQENIWSIMDEKRRQMRSYMMSIHEGRKQIHEVAAGSYDAAQVQKLADAQGKAMANLIVLRTHTRVKIQSILTPEQQLRFKELRNQRHSGLLEH